MLFFTNIPCFAQSPFATTIASGVARPSAQGHATTRTVTNDIIASLTEYPRSKYPIKVTIDSTIIVGTNIPLTLSAILAIGALVFTDSITKRTISLIVESLPIFSALYSKYPSTFILPAMTLFPTVFFTKALSPVINASFK